MGCERIKNLNFVRWKAHFLFHLGDTAAAIAGLAGVFFERPETGLLAEHPFWDGWHRGDDHE